MARWLSIGLVLTLSACGGPPTFLEPEAAAISGIEGETLQVEFTMRDEDGTAVRATDVEFALEGAPPEIEVRPMTATTDSRGGVTAILTLGAVATFDLVASSGDATPGVVTITVEARAAPYLDCMTDATCAPSERCLDVQSMGTSGRMCTRECSADAECPTRTEEGAACMTAGTRPVCLARCAGPTDCVVGNVCVDYSSREGTNRVCLPR